MFKPKGVYVAMLTPFNREASINEEEVRKIVDFFISSGVHGLFPVSSVGEYIHMERQEKIKLTEIVVDQARGRVPIIPGVGSSYPEESIFLAKKFEDIGCNAIVIPPPYFFKLSQRMIQQFFESIIDKVNIPVMLYNVPFFTQSLSYGVVENLLSRKNITGMKDSSGSMVDLMHFMDMAKILNKDLSFMTGRSEMLLATLLMGGKGCMTATANVLPEILVEIYNNWEKKNIDIAVNLQYTLLKAIRTMSTLPTPIGFKLALETRGFNMGSPKQPYSEDISSKIPGFNTKIKRIINSLLESIKK
jgi:4-hydroxy-tetrahydrodipicolinate synthase